MHVCVFIRRYNCLPLSNLLRNSSEDNHGYLQIKPFILYFFYLTLGKRKKIKIRKRAEIKIKIKKRNPKKLKKVCFV